MAKDCCGGNTCSCLVTGGLGIVITGAGTPTNPYVVGSNVDVSQSLTVFDTESVNLTLWGSGTTEDPFRLQADSAMRLSTLVDVQDPEGGPSVGEGPVWVGVGVDGHWEFRLPTPTPAGAVSVGAGLSGIGSAPSPIIVQVSGTWGTASLAGLGSDSLIGLAIYVDSAGQLRAQPGGAGGTTWSAITGKPTTFAPTAHTHPASQISDPLNLDVGKIAGQRIYSTASGATAPTSPAPALGDLWFYNAT